MRFTPAARPSLCGRCQTIGCSCHKLDEPNVERQRCYCWRTGCVVELAVLGDLSTERCPECSHLHAPLEDQSKCGCFVALDRNGGVPCDKEARHPGPHGSAIKVLQALAPDCVDRKGPWER